MARIKRLSVRHEIEITCYKSLDLIGFDDNTCGDRDVPIHYKICGCVHQKLKNNQIFRLSLPPDTVLP